MIVIFDIDGTLADVTEILPLWQVAKEAFWRSVGEAVVIEPMRKLYHALFESGHDICFYTARPEKIRDTTIKWLEKNGVFCEKLLMAKDNDIRHDIEIKLEMLRENDLTPDNVAFIVEDRSCIVEALRKAGYTVLQCAEGEY